MSTRVERQHTETVPREDFGVSPNTRTRGTRAVRDNDRRAVARRDEPTGERHVIPRLERDVLGRRVEGAGCDRHRHVRHVRRGDSLHQRPRAHVDEDQHERHDREASPTPPSADEDRRAADDQYHAGEQRDGARNRQRCQSRLREVRPRNPGPDRGRDGAGEDRTPAPHAVGTALRCVPDERGSEDDEEEPGRASPDRAVMDGDEGDRETARHRGAQQQTAHGDPFVR